MIEEVKTKITISSDEYTIEFANTLLNRLEIFLRETKIPQEKNIEYYTLLKTATTDVSFACELYIKSLLYKQGINWDNWKNHKTGHSLGLLFSQLDESTQKEVSRITHINLSSLKSELNREGNSEAFTKSRYSYEYHTGYQNYELLTKICIALATIANNQAMHFEIQSLSNIPISTIDKIVTPDNKKEIIRKHTEHLWNKSQLLNESPSLSEEENYIRKNLSTTDLALFTELRFKYFNNKKQSHEYTKLYNRMSAAFKFIVSKMSYVNYNVNHKGQMNFRLALESLLFPENFEATYKSDLHMIMSEINDSFEKSRFCTTEYFENYEDIKKFAIIIFQVTDLIMADEEKFNTVFDKKEQILRMSEEVFMNLNLSVDEYLELNVKHIRDLLPMFTSAYGVNKRVFFFDEETHHMLLEIIRSEYVLEIKKVINLLTPELIHKIFDGKYEIIKVLEIICDSRKEVAIEQIDFEKAIELLKVEGMINHPSYYVDCLINNDYDKESNKSKIHELDEKLSLVFGLSDKSISINNFINKSYNLFKNNIDINAAIAIYSFICKVTKKDIDVERHQELFAQSFETIVACYKCLSSIYTSPLEINDLVKFLTYANLELIDKFINNGYFYEYPNLINVEFLCSEKAINRALKYLKKHRQEFNKEISPIVFICTDNEEMISTLMSLDNPNNIVSYKSIYTKDPSTISEILNLSKEYHISNLEEFITHYDSKRVTELINYLKEKNLNCLISGSILTRNSKEEIIPFVEHTIIGTIGKMPYDTANSIIPSVQSLLKNSTIDSFHYESSLEICRLDIVNDYPHALTLYGSSTSDFYRLNLFNTLYCKIKSGVLTDEQNQPFTIDSDKIADLTKIIIECISKKNLLKNLPLLLQNRTIVQHLDSRMVYLKTPEELRGNLKELKDNSPTFTDNEIPGFTKSCLELSGCSYKMKHIKTIYNIYTKCYEARGKEILIEYVNYILNNTVFEEFIKEKEESLAYLLLVKDKIDHIEDFLIQINLKKSTEIKPFGNGGEFTYITDSFDQPHRNNSHFTFMGTPEEDISSGVAMIDMINSVLDRADESYQKAAEEFKKIVDKNAKLKRANEILKGVKKFLYVYYSEKRIKFDYALLNKADEIRSKFL